MTIFGITFYPYGTALAAAAGLCLLLAALNAKKTGLKQGTIALFAPLAVVLGVLCARLLYCLFCWSWFTEKGIGYFFTLNEGRFMLYGAAIGCALAALQTAKRTGQTFGRVADTVAAPAALMIAFSRLAEGLVGQGYGWSLADWFSVDAFDAEEYTGLSLFHLEDASAFERFPFAIADNMYGEYHWAVFVLEALIALVIAVVLWRMAEKRPGWKALLLMLLYGASQCVCESMRQDAVVRLGFVRMSQILSAVCVVAVLVICAAKLPAAPGKKKQVIISSVGVVLMIGVLTLMEFALEKHSRTIVDELTGDLCYLVMIAAAAGMILFVLPLWRGSSRASMK